MYCAIKDCSKLAEHIICSEGKGRRIYAEACEEHKELVQKLLNYSAKREREEEKKMTICKFDHGWAGRCKEPAEEGKDFCLKHLKEKCCVCGEQATRECSYTGQFVCGAPLCDNCEGWEDLSKPSGGWGFLNHSHRRKGEKK